MSDRARRNRRTAGMVLRPAATSSPNVFLTTSPGAAASAAASSSGTSSCCVLCGIYWGYCIMLGAQAAGGSDRLRRLIAAEAKRTSRWTAGVASRARLATVGDAGRDRAARAVRQRPSPLSLLVASPRQRVEGRVCMSAKRGAKRHAPQELFAASCSSRHRSAAAAARSCLRWERGSAGSAELRLAWGVIFAFVSKHRSSGPGGCAEVMLTSVKNSK